MGAGGRDFWNFLVYFKDNPEYEVVAFTAAQIPGIEKRRFPRELAGKLYSKDILIYSEEDLPRLIRDKDIDYVYLCYSDLSHDDVMHKASIVLANGANFAMLGTSDTVIEAKVPVVAVCAVRTGSGKSQTARRVAEILKGVGKKVVVVRHPMPYGDLTKQVCQRFENLSDLDRYECTIEEREEYEAHIKNSTVVYAGVDYKKILEEAEKEADIILWDGGNNDMPFYMPDILIVVVDPHRAGHELRYYPGEVNFRKADVIVINKMDTAPKEGIKTIKENIRKTNPKATVVEAASPISVDNPTVIRNKSVLIIEDGPTLTHGGMRYGAGEIAAEQHNCRIVDPRKYATGSIKGIYKKYPHLTNVLPAMGYSEEQVKELEKTINRADCDAVIIGTPIDLRKLIRINKPTVRVSYRLEEIGRKKLKDVLKRLR